MTDMSIVLPHRMKAAESKYHSIVGEGKEHAYSQKQQKQRKHRNNPKKKGEIPYEENFSK